MRWNRQNIFVIAGFVITGFVSTNFTVIPSDVFRYNGVFVIAGFHRIVNSRFAST